MLQTQPQAILRLLCFPYAGGGANIFRTWQDNLPTTVEVCPVQLPGRERRLLEPPLTNLRLLVEAAARALLPYLDKPFAFFGHSMGATISFELARHLRQEKNVKPVHLFVSGRRAPQLPERHASTYDLPDAEFLEELRRLKGTPREVKATGKGLSLPLHQFDVSRAPGEPARLVSTRGNPQEASRWTLRELAPGPGYVAALAVEGRDWRLNCWQWSNLAR